MSLTPLHLMALLSRPATGGVHPLGWAIAGVAGLLSFGAADTATVLWSTGLVSAGVLLAGAVGFLLITVFLLVSVWVLETK